jgi:hypothetical protein
MSDQHKTQPNGGLGSIRLAAIRCLEHHSPPCRERERGREKRERREQREKNEEVKRIQISVYPSGRKFPARRSVALCRQPSCGG